MSNEVFAFRLRMLRERRRVSRRVLAELCGVSKSAMARYERGEREPGIGVVCELADYFGVSADYLLGREET